MNKQIDVLIAAYNGEKYIKRCLDSLLNQTYQNFNIIINNNGSTDKTAEILEEYAKNNKNIEVFVTKNEKNIAKARSDLLKKVKSEYFTFVDCDDYVESDYLKVLVSLIEKHKADISICSRSKHKENKKVLLSKKNEKRQEETIFEGREAIMEMLSYKKFCGTVYAKLFKTSTLKNISFNENVHYGEDLLFCFLIMQNCKTAVFSNKELYHYIIRDGSITTTGFNKRKLTVLDACDLMAKKSKEDEEVLTSVLSLKSLLAMRQLLNAWKAKSKDKAMKKRLKQIAQDGLVFIKKNKHLKPLHKMLPYVFWIFKML